MGFIASSCYDTSMSNRSLIVCAWMIAMACGGDDEALVESSALNGEWSGVWAQSFFQGNTASEPISLSFSGARLASGRLRNMDFALDDRSVLFDDRRNGVVYEEGDRLFRTNAVLPDDSSWSLGFITDATGDRALIADFFSRVGAMQKTSTTPSEPVDQDVEGTWSGRYVALDNTNPDDAELEIGDLSIDCVALTCSASGTRSFQITLMPADGPVWAGSVQGLVPVDELINVRAVITPDGRMLAIAACASPNDVQRVGLFCAYAALSRP